MCAFRFFQVFSGSFRVGEFVVRVVGEFNVDDLAAVRRVGGELAEEKPELAAGGVEFLRVEGARAKRFVHGAAEFKANDSGVDESADAAVDAVDLLEE